MLWGSTEQTEMSYCVLRFRPFDDQPQGSTQRTFAEEKRDVEDDHHTSTPSPHLKITEYVVAQEEQL